MSGPGFDHGARAQPDKPTPIQQQVQFTPCCSSCHNVPCCVCAAVLEQRMRSVGSIPGRFRSALGLLGIEAAIESLLQVLGSGQ